jgi:hypothetical protein
MKLQLFPPGLPLENTAKEQIQNTSVIPTHAHKGIIHAARRFMLLVVLSVLNTPVRSNEPMNPEQPCGKRKSRRAASTSACMCRTTAAERTHLADSAGIDRRFKKWKTSRRPASLQFGRNREGGGEGG